MEKIFAKKSLGQHFLTSRAYLRAMVEAGEVKEGDVVLEIGPGKGSLTEELLARKVRVIAVEKDNRLLPVLTEKFADAIEKRQLQIVEADILQFEIANYLQGNFKLIANIPYYISGAIMEKFLGKAPRPTTMALLVQKEVAQRIARSKKESILSLSVKAYGEPKYIKTVPRGAFSPAPNVDSAILAIKNISAKNFTNSAQEKKFFELLHAGFAHKRKLLARNVEPLFGRVGAEEAVAKAGIAPNARAEDVSLAAWLALVKK